jgi:hypothetical protein
MKNRGDKNCYAQLNGHYDFNRPPMAPPTGTLIIVVDTVEFFPSKTAMPQVA